MSNGVTNRLILETMNRSFDGIDRRFDKVDGELGVHNKRLNTLEKFKDRVLFSWAVATTAAAVGYEYIKSKFFNK